MSHKVEITCCNNCPDSEWINTSHAFADSDYTLYCKIGNDGHGCTFISNPKEIAKWCPLEAK